MPFIFKSLAKFNTILLLFCLFSFSCAPQSNSGLSGKNPMPTDQVTQQNYNTLTANDWCEIEDFNRDGKISAFRFMTNGKVYWIGLTADRQQSYSKELLAYSIRRDFVQVGVNLGTSFGEKISFSGFGADRRIQMTPFNSDQSSDQAVSTQPSFIGQNCELNRFL